MRLVVGAHTRLSKNAARAPLPFTQFPPVVTLANLGCSIAHQKGGCPSRCWVGVGVLAPTKSLLAPRRGTCSFQMDSDTPTPTQSLWHVPVWGLGFWSQPGGGGIWAPSPAFAGVGGVGPRVWLEYSHCHVKVFCLSGCLFPGPLARERSFCSGFFFFSASVGIPGLPGISAASLGYMAPPPKIQLIYYCVIFQVLGPLSALPFSLHFANLTDQVQGF